MQPVCFVNVDICMRFSQVVVKTKADYDAESKKGKLRSPKIAEFSISIIEGVSERLKVRTIWPLSPLPVTDHHLICFIPPVSAAPSMLLFVSCATCLHVWAIVWADSFNPTPKMLINSAAAMATASKQQHLHQPPSHSPLIANRCASYRMSRISIKPTTGGAGAKL